MMYEQQTMTQQQTVTTLIRMLLNEQSDVGLHCLQRPISPKIGSLIQCKPLNVTLGILLHLRKQVKSLYINKIILKSIYTKNKPE